MSEGVRLQRYLAQAGVASRRKSELLITEGRVTVNGTVVTTLGTRVDPERDRVAVDGKRLRPEQHAYLLLHKPRGVITSMSDPQGRPSVAELLPADGPRVLPVGRLDFNSEGVLLCTNDGALAHALAHPSRRVKKVYRVRVRGKVDDATLQQLSNGVLLDDGPTAPATVLVTSETPSHTWLQIAVHEGRNRLIRRMCEALDLPVMRLIRSEFAGLTVADMPPGSHRPLSRRDVAHLKTLAERKPQARRPAKGPRRPRGGK